MSKKEIERLLNLARNAGCDVDGDILYDTVTGKTYYVEPYNNVCKLAEKPSPIIERR